MVRRLLPKSLRNLRHLFYAWYGAVKYRNPSEKLLVIGVTGTSGKSTTVFLLRQLLEFAGFKVGSLSTIDFCIAGENKLNDQKMTMLGKMQIQKFLREMVERGCEVAIVETTSEGAVQYRDRFINFDFMLLTNLYPEHIESHGSYENYTKAKLGIFSRAGHGKRKVLADEKFRALQNNSRGHSEIVKTAIVNADIAEVREFLSAGNFERRVTFAKNNVSAHFVVEDLHSDKDGLHFKVGDYRFEPEMYGEHNALNITSAIAVARQLDVPWAVIQKAVHTFRNAPGRNECIPEAEARGFKVIVDYAFEPKAMAALYSVVDLLAPRRVVHVFGSTGGGRDVSRRFTVGEMVGKRADVCIVTDEDPYDDDPQKIMADVASAVRKTGKRDGVDLFIIGDRRAAIAKALTLAQLNDVVLVTGKGSEQAIVVAGGQKIPWDDRQVVREELLHC